MTLRNFIMDHVELDSRILIMQDTDDDVPKHEFYGRMSDRVFLKYIGGYLKDRQVLEFWFNADGYVVVIISNHD